MEMCEPKDASDLQCRLCTSTEEGQLQIFGIDGQMRNILDKIRDCLPVTVKNDDLLPKWVCQQCAQQLDQFDLFRKNCALVENKLEQSLKETSEFALEPECCLQEVELDSPEKPADVKPETLYNIKCLEDGMPTGAALDAIEGMTITPMLSGDGHNQQPDVQLGSPTPDDYVLMKEETFRTDGKRQKPIEECLCNEKDSDIVKAQKLRREVLPPMWDVYERASTYSTLVTHRRYIVNKAAFPCSLCNKCFSVTQGYQRDGMPTAENDERSSVEEGNPGIRFYSCHKCWKVFPKRSSLKRHQRMHIDVQSHMCPLCGKVYGRKEHLSRHMISHTGGRPYACELCSKPFVRKEHLDRHRLSHCKMLLEQEMTMASPSTHVDELSAGEQLLTCDICIQTFCGSEQLVQHQRQVHSAFLSGQDDLIPKLHSCTICSKLFTRKEHLVRHLKVHQRESSNSNMIMALSSAPLMTRLPQCNNSDNNKDNDIKQFFVDSALKGLAEVKVEGEEINLEGSTSRSGVEVDVGVENALTVQKDESGHSLFDKSQSSDGSGNTTSGADGSTDGSMLDSTGSSVKPHPCPSCTTKSFSRKSHLVRHFKRAHPNQPVNLVVSSTRNDYSEVYKDCVLSNGQHLCKFCGKMFGRRYHLIRHMKLHLSGEVPSFHCSLCNKSFADRRRLRSHNCNGKVGSLLKGATDSAELTKENRIANVNGEVAADKTVLGKNTNSGPFRENVEAGDKVSADVTKREARSLESEAARPKVKSSAGRSGARKRGYGYHHECVTCGINFSKKKLLKRHVESAHADSSLDEPL